MHLQIKDAEGNQLTTDPETGVLQCAPEHPETESDELERPKPWHGTRLSSQKHSKNSASELPIVKITIETTPKLQKLWAEADEREAKKQPSSHRHTIRS